MKDKTDLDDVGQVKKTTELTKKAFDAVNDLSNHLKAIGDEENMHRANRAINELWKIE